VTRRLCRCLVATIASVSTFLATPTGAVFASQTPGTWCDPCPSTPTILDCYDWAQQWTSNSSHTYHPGSGCPENDSYFGWVGINAQMITPPHYPSLDGNNQNHSAGWINISFSCNCTLGSWIQIGWLLGCAADFVPSKT